MTKTESIKAIADATDKTPREVKEFLELVGKVAERTVKKMDSLILPGLGKLAARKRAARIARNPATGEQVKVPAKKVVKFTVAKVLKDAVAVTK